MRRAVPPPGLLPGAVRGAAAGVASGQACWAAGEPRGALPPCMRILAGAACTREAQWQEVCVCVCVCLYLCLRVCVCVRWPPNRPKL